MLELVQHGEDWKLGYGGDTLNTAIHLARFGIRTGYLTALGSDRFSAQLKTEWAGEGLDNSLVLAHPERHPGLYAISTDAAGERSFTYWRGESAARSLFSCEGIEAAIERVRQADLFAFSLISLAILPPAGRERLLALARSVRANGGKVAFDGNYRERLWEDRNDAIAMRDAALGCADIGLPTLEDERSLSGLRDGEAVLRHWTALGCEEVAVKLGAEGCLLTDGSIIEPDHVLDPIDTSGAGDALNGGYLAARLRGEGPSSAAASGHALAGWCIMRPGAIPARNIGDDPYAPLPAHEQAQ